ncbi:MAG TPA: hypothetical protein VGO00_10755 [Kofleriaceae bacterium]|jgi:hypothetical protein|nr:hypothetical protein [Kofleriaceae bacterium]
MRCQLASAVALIVGCQPQARAPTLSNKPSTRVVTPTCKEVGVILRLRVNNEDTAGPDKEATIAGACDADHWSNDVITCVASNPHPRSCLDALTEAQHVSYDAKLEAWATKWSEDLDQGDRTAEAGDPEPIDCADAIGDAAIYLPAVTLTGDDRELVVKIRHDAIVKQCEAGWGEDVKQCLKAATDPTGMVSCLTTLDPQQQQDLATKIAAADTLMTRTIGARAKAPDCKKLVATHYADAAWKTKLDTVKGADRKKMVDASRKRMTEACTKETWSPTLRACLGVGGDADCVAGQSYAWGFPARGVVVPTGIVECDAYIAAIQSYSTCAKLPADARDAVAQSIAEATQAMLEMAADPAKRQEAQESCRVGAEAVKQSLASMGC